MFVRCMTALVAEKLSFSFPHLNLFDLSMLQCIFFSKYTQRIQLSYSYNDDCYDNIVNVVRGKVMYHAPNMTKR